MNKMILALVLGIACLMNAQIYSNKDIEICNSKFDYAVKNKLYEKPIGYIIAEMGKSFIGTNYVAHTLEKGKTESLVVDFTGLDCTTFLETNLTLARCIKERKTTFENYQNELKKIRYRNGIIDQYPSRLHYFSDWIYDNIKKGIVENISQKLGGEPIKFNVYYMSKNPASYEQLDSNPSFIPTIEKQEKEINSREYYYIPKGKVFKAEKEIHSGDLIAFTTDAKGLDISHVGIAVKTDDGVVHLMHAPNVGYKVQISPLSLADYITKVKKDTGIIVLRAEDPK